MLNLDHRSQEQKVLLENMAGSEGRKKNCIHDSLFGSFQLCPVIRVREASAH